MAIYPLENSVQTYAWGDPDLIPAFLELPNPEREPWAELWLGAHPKAPSLALLPGGEKLPLNELIARDTKASLGQSELAYKRLPFLFKMLAVAHPLSLQAHPSKLTALRGYRREERAGVMIDPAERSYIDSHPKPEFIVAMDRFEGMCGFRPIDEILRNIRVVAGDNWLAYAGRLARYPSKMELALVFYNFLTLESAERGKVLMLARQRIDRILESAKPGSAERHAFGWIPRLMDAFPNDMGSLAPLMLNCFDISAGEGLYVAPGQPHAYFRGCALEVMANSDNEVRAGLTRKRKDLAEFMAVLDFSAAPLRIALPRDESPDTEGDSAMCPYDIDSEEFSLAIIRVSGAARRYDRPRAPEILLCVEGALQLRSASGANFPLTRGSSLFVEACESGYELAGRGMLYRASVGGKLGGKEA
jgi:mannose-6-phosphate isomerase